MRAQRRYSPQHVNQHVSHSAQDSTYSMVHGQHNVGCTCFCPPKGLEGANEAAETALSFAMMAADSATKDIRKPRRSLSTAGDVEEDDNSSRSTIGNEAHKVRNGQRPQVPLLQFTTLDETGRTVKKCLWTAKDVAQEMANVCVVDKVRHPPSCTRNIIMCGRSAFGKVVDVDRQGMWTGLGSASIPCIIVGKRWLFGR